jgi:hypothetical protein
MSFCEHCQGQRFDRAQVLRALRQLRRESSTWAHSADVDAALARALDTVRDLDLPHLGPPDDDEDIVVH